MFRNKMVINAIVIIVLDVACILWQIDEQDDKNNGNLSLNCEGMR